VNLIGDCIGNIPPTTFVVKLKSQGGLRLISMS